MRQRNRRAGVLGSHLPWGDPRRAWDFVSIGRGDVPWDDTGMDCLRGARSSRIHQLPALATSERVLRRGSTLGSPHPPDEWVNPSTE